MWSETLFRPGFKHSSWVIWSQVSAKYMSERTQMLPGRWSQKPHPEVVSPDVRYLLKTHIFPTEASHVEAQTLTEAPNGMWRIHLPVCTAASSSVWLGRQTHLLAMWKESVIFSEGFYGLKKAAHSVNLVFKSLFVSSQWHNGSPRVDWSFLFSQNSSVGAPLPS